MTYIRNTLTWGKEGLLYGILQGIPGGILKGICRLCRGNCVK